MLCLLIKRQIMSALSRSLRFYTDRIIPILKSLRYIKYIDMKRPLWICAATDRNFRTPECTARNDLYLGRGRKRHDLLSENRSVSCWWAAYSFAPCDACRQPELLDGCLWRALFHPDRAWLCRWRLRLKKPILGLSAALKSSITALPVWTGGRVV